MKCRFLQAAPACPTHCRPRHISNRGKYILARMPHCGRKIVRCRDASSVLLVGRFSPRYHGKPPAPRQESAPAPVGNRAPESLRTTARESSSAGSTRPSTSLDRFWSIVRCALSITLQHYHSGGSYSFKVQMFNVGQGFLIRRASERAPSARLEKQLPALGE